MIERERRRLGARALAPQIEVPTHSHYTKKYKNAYIINIECNFACIITKRKRERERREQIINNYNTVLKKKKKKKEQNRRREERERNLNFCNIFCNLRGANG